MNETIREKALRLVANGMPPIQVAKLVGVHFTTVYKYVRDEREKRMLPAG